MLAQALEFLLQLVKVFLEIIDGRDHVGMRAARELMLLGETWDAARALQEGLVNRVVPRSHLGGTELALARMLAGSTVTAEARAAAERLMQGAS